MFKRILLAALLPVALAAPTAQSQVSSELSIEMKPCDNSPKFLKIEGFDSKANYEQHNMVELKSPFPLGCDIVCLNDVNCLGYIDGISVINFGGTDRTMRQCWIKRSFKGEGINSYEMKDDYQRHVNLKIQKPRDYQVKVGQDIKGGYVLYYSQERKKEKLGAEEFLGNCTALCNATPECKGFVASNDAMHCWLKGGEDLNNGFQADDRLTSYLL